MAFFYDERINLSDWLAGEIEDIPRYCREEVTVEAGAELQTGALLGIVTATGEYAEYDPDGTDGVQAFKGFLISTYLPGDTSASQKAVALVRGPASIKEAGIRWPSNAEAGDKTTVKAAMKALGFIIRQSA
jgi:hypothetical protein